MHNRNIFEIYIPTRICMCEIHPYAYEAVKIFWPIIYADRSIHWWLPVTHTHSGNNGVERIGFALLEPLILFMAKQEGTTTGNQQKETYSENGVWIMSQCENSRINSISSDDDNYILKLTMGLTLKVLK